MEIYFDLWIKSKITDGAGRIDHIALCDDELAEAAKAKYLDGRSMQNEYVEQVDVNYFRP